MKRHWIAVLAVLACLPSVSAAPQQSESFAIVPGQRIGQTHLGPNGSRDIARLPKPQASDAGMSQTRSVWTSLARGSRRLDTLFIHTVSNGALNVKPLDGVTIDVIRVTSPQFHTAQGLTPGSTLAFIRRRLPHIKAAPGAPTIYDDLGEGIAFEFAKVPQSNTRCIAVMIHPRGEANTATARQVRSLLQEPPH